MISCVNSYSLSVGIRLTISDNEYHQKRHEVQQLPEDRQYSQALYALRCSVLVFASKFHASSYFDSSSRRLRTFD